ncbi:MAG: LytTR family DNA-binding domain-containing protein [Clostridia bacterium]|nr:LytTR family DNA-binding domain-containing protein [Clostridia bacterium]
MRTKLIICDDDVYTIKMLKSILANFNSIEVVGEACNGEECIALIHEKKPSILFCDINLPTINGIDAAKIIKDSFPDLYVVFISGYSEYAIESFAAQPFDFIVKPFDTKKVYSTINNLLKSIQERSLKDKNKLESLILPYADEINIVTQSDIIFVTREKSITVVYTQKNKYFTYESLETIESRLNKQLFLRSHKSYIINKSKVEKIVINNKTSYKVLFTGYKDFAYITSGNVQEIRSNLAF